MVSRRIFLIKSLGLLSLQGYVSAAFAKRVKNVIKKLGPHSLGKQEWPPAISPDFVAVLDKGYAFFGDELGRLSIVDIKREDNPKVMGELASIGRKVIAWTVADHRAYALCLNDYGADCQYMLAGVCLVPASDPSVMSRIPLSYFSEPNHLAAGGGVVCIGGVGLSGESLVTVFSSAGKRKTSDKELLASLVLDEPVVNINLQDKQLLVVQGQTTGDFQIELVSLANPRLPECGKKLNIGSGYLAMSRIHEMLLVVGQRHDKHFYGKLILLRPTPKIVDEITLPSIAEVLDIAAQKGQFLVLANDGKRTSVIPITFDKSLKAELGHIVPLPPGSKGGGSKARLAVKDRDAYVASDWGGVQVLNIQKTGWQYSYSHTVPRLPASDVVVYDSKAILAGADLKLYDFTQPARPSLVAAVDIGSPVKSILAVGDHLLCFSRDTLTLRPIEKLDSISASLNISGSHLAYDQKTGLAYINVPREKHTIVHTIAVSPTSLTIKSSQEIARVFRQIIASDGQLMLGDLNELALYRLTADKPELVGKRNLANLAIRNLFLSDQYGVVCAVDKNLKGYLLTIAISTNDLPTLGSTDLPQDAVALDVAYQKAVVVGRKTDGTSVATFINLISPSRPEVVTSLPILEAASAVAIKNTVAVVAGRGLEILSLG